MSWLSCKDGHVLPGVVLRGSCLSTVCHMEKPRITDNIWNKGGLPLYLQTLCIFSSPFMSKSFHLSIFLTLFLFSQLIFPIAQPPTPTLTSTIPLSRCLSSLYPSFSETDNKASFSMADLQFTPASTPSQATDRGLVTARDPVGCRMARIWVPLGFWSLWLVCSVLLSAADGVKQTPDMYTCTQIEGNSNGFRRNKGSEAEEKRRMLK